jgi:hypothetical protein
VHIATKVMVVVLLGLGLTGMTFAIEQPPATASQQRSWLVGHFASDMQSVGSFTGNDVAQMVNLVCALPDQQVGLLARFYYLTREKTEQDVQLYAIGQADTGAALAQAQAQVTDLLAQLQNQIQQIHSELAPINPEYQTLCEDTYASVPGWCACNQYAIPDSYYSGGGYVGPAYSANYCGAYAGPVYRAFYNRSSHYNWWNRRAFIHKKISTPGHLPKVNHAPATVVRHDMPKPSQTMTLGNKHIGAAAAVHLKTARPVVNHPTPHAVAHYQPRPAAHSAGQGRHK